MSPRKHVRSGTLMPVSEVGPPTMPSLHGDPLGTRRHERIRPRPPHMRTGPAPERGAASTAERTKGAPYTSCLEGTT